MTIINLDFNTLTVAAPYVIGSPPDNLTGYSVVTGANNGKIYSVLPKVWSANGTNAMWRNDTPLSSLVIKVSAALPTPVSSNAAGVSFVNASGNGLMLITGTSANNFRIFAVVAGQLSGGALWTQATSPVAGATVEFRRTFTGGNYEYEVFQNAVKVGATYVNNTYNTDMYGSVVSRGGDIRTMAVEYTPAQTLDTLTDPLVAGAAFSGTCAGFTDGAATLSSNGVSVAVTIASGAFSGTWPIAVDEQAYPTLPKSAQTITLTQGGNTATITSDLEQPVVDDDTYLTYYIEQDGFTADGGQFVFTPYSDLVIGTDGGALVTGAGTIVGYFIPATGTGAGNAYYYTFNVIDGGAVANGGLSVAGLSNSGLSNSGLSVTGL